jgi:hypothetical protein
MRKLGTWYRDAQTTICFPSAVPGRSRLLAILPAQEIFDNQMTTRPDFFIGRRV